MLEKMTPNQRLMIAIVLSVLFFVAYTAIFPPEQQSAKVEQTKTQNPQTSSQPQVSKAENVVNHEISTNEKMAANNSSALVTVKNSNFILKLDTLGRISSKELLQEKYNDKWITRFGLVKNQYIVMVSRLVPHKGAHILIEAFKQFKNEQPDNQLKLAIVGGSVHTDDYCAALKEAAKE
ncbi:MAG: glycosyltransferase, partial [Campylobacterota bacterium]